MSVQSAAELGRCVLFLKKKTNQEEPPRPSRGPQVGPEGVSRAPRGLKVVGEGVSRASRGVKVVGEGVPRASRGVKVVGEGVSRGSLRPWRAGERAGAVLGRGGGRGGGIEAICPAEGARDTRARPWRPTAF